MLIFVYYRRTKEVTLSCGHAVGVVVFDCLGSIACWVAGWHERRIYELLLDGTHAMGSAPYPPTANFKRPFRCCIGLITRLLLITSIPVIRLLNHYT